MKWKEKLVLNDAILNDYLNQMKVILKAKWIFNSFNETLSLQLILWKILSLIQKTEFYIF